MEKWKNGKMANTQDKIPLFLDQKLFFDFDSSNTFFRRYLSWIILTWFFVLICDLLEYEILPSNPLLTSLWRDAFLTQQLFNNVRPS